MLPLVLASRSPRRISLIQMITSDYEVCPSQFDESSIVISEPDQLVTELSLQKAKAVLPLFPNKLILGCDTVVALDHEVFGIPQNQNEAYVMLSALSGKTHSVISGVTLLSENQTRQFVCETKVTFYTLSSEEIQSYITTKEPYDKAGGYGIQSLGGLFVKEIQGDYYNVVGLPIARLKRELDLFL